MKHTTTSAVAAATAAVCALAFAPAPTAGMTPLGADSDARTKVVRMAPESELDGLRLSPGADGAIDRDDLVLPLGGIASDADRLAPATHRDATRRLLEDAGLAVVDLRAGCPDCEPEEGEDPEEWTPESFTYTYASAVGDVTGDGFGELVRSTFSYDADTDEFGETAEVLDGHDGASLWSTSTSDGYLVTVPDMDGDRVADLMLIGFDFSFEFGEECDADGCTYTDELRMSRTLDLVRGLDGAPLGGTVVNSRELFEFSESESGTAVIRETRQAERYFAEDLLTELDVADGDADGAHELVIGLVTIDEAYSADVTGVAVPFVEPGVAEISWRAVDTSSTTVLDLAAGTQRVLHDTADDGRIALPSVVSDPAGDVVLMSSFDATDEAGTETCIEAFFGVCPDGLAGELTGAEGDQGTPPAYALLTLDGEERWSVPASAESFALVSAEGDVDGDGLVDLIDLTYDEEGQDVVTLLRGADGSNVWTAPVVYAQSNGDDLVGIDVTFTEDPSAPLPDGEDEGGGELIVDVVLLDGASGAERTRVEAGRPTFTENEDGGFTEDYLTVDLMPIVGELDVLVLNERVVYELVESECGIEVDEETGEEYEYCYEFYIGHVESSTLKVLDGTDLSSRVDRDLGTSFLRAIAPLDDAPGAELLVVAPGEEPEESDGWFFGPPGPVTATTLDGSPLWTLDGVYLDDLQQTPDGTLDVLTYGHADDRMLVRDGATSAVRLDLGVGSSEGEVVVGVVVVD